MLTFQQLIHKLSTYWEREGCVIHQGHDLETGAGTFNPATFLRSLGPEPYNTAYVEPSRRPKDGRYGENPNRMQLFHQFQVILKPSPPDIQKKYIQSLKAIGINLKDHDLRFVHDDWESPTLGAFGLGWEVWLDGMEVSQFTYFQAVASIPLKPISGELTYGLERLAMYIQNVDSMYDIKWNDTLTLRDIVHRNEVEWSAYNFVEASTEMWLRHFDDYEREAKTLIGRHLPIPAYDFVIKASHAFNMLDARGAISTTERTGYIGRIRDLARLIADEYLTSREKLGFPLLASQPVETPKIPKAGKLPRSFDPYRSSDFLLEIGSEELPATFIPIGMKSLEHHFRRMLQEKGLTCGEIETFGSPRRLGLYVQGLPEGIPDQEIERRGPAVASAFDLAGSPTAQGAGFLKSVQLSSVSLKDVRAGKYKNLEVRTIKDVEYLFAKLTQKGRSIYEILSKELLGLILNIDFPKKMRWGTLDIAYARPIHWITALYGDRVVPFVLGDVSSNKFSFGHSQLAPVKIVLKEAKDYFKALEEHKVLVRPSMRQDTILDQLALLENKLGCQALQKERVLSEVVYLTEWPILTSTDFDARFLKVPAEVLISEMVEHQRYFPLADPSGKLKNLFVITADNTPTPLILRGNQKVLSARLSDGHFLYELDLKTPLESFNQSLAKMTFQKDLGTVLDKVMRLVKVAALVNETLELADHKKLARAALLCKADLVTELVGEFPELQGTIGKYYALAHHEDKEVAAAIEEHWYPKSEQGKLPETPCGIILSLADKIDNLLSYFSVGLKPTSSSDPYALRRQAIGLFKVLIANKLSVNLKELLKSCQFKSDPAIIDEILRFFAQRSIGILEDYGFPRDGIEAVLQEQCIDPYDQYCKVAALNEFRTSSDAFAKLTEVYKRAKGQLEKVESHGFNPVLAIEPAERELTTALAHMEKSWKGLLADKQYARAFAEMAKLQKPLAHLFDTVKILAEDPKLRENRIGLLQKVFGHFTELLDFGKLQA